MNVRAEYDQLALEFQATEEAVRSGKAPFDKAAAEAANKFPGVYPYPENELRTPNGLYVNASRMSPSVIAAQYPTAGYYARWWTALLQSGGVTAILMLCQAGESLIQPLYFASRAFASVEFTDCDDSGLCVLVHTLTATWYVEEHVTLRVLNVQLYHRDTPTQRTTYTVNHLHYADWPDCAAPRDMRVLLLLAKQLAHHVSAVHCRAGIGRTGTFLSVLMIREEEESAMSVVRRLRLLRPLLAHNFAQYQFIHRFVQTRTQFMLTKEARSVCMPFSGYCAVVPVSVELVLTGERVGWNFIGRRLILCLQELKQLDHFISRLRPLFFNSRAFLELDRLRRRDWNGVHQEMMT